jgi:hypothetical protein
MVCPRRSPLHLALAAILLLATLPGCSTHHTVMGQSSPVPTAPAPDSPAGVIHLFQWSWENRDTLHIAEVLTDDFRFAFSATDSTGAGFSNWALDRDQYLECVGHLFQGSGPTPPAQRIVLYFDPNLIAMPDDRSGKTDPWHKTIRTGVNLTIDNGIDVWRITGYARFYVVRGDSAAIPPELVARGFRPDSLRWWVERMEDETGGSGGARAIPARPLPTKSVTWGQVLALYLGAF